MRIVIAATLLVLLPLCAFAEDTVTTTTTTAPTFSSADLDFTLTLPEGGTLSDAGTEGWQYEDPTVFTWVAVEESPLFLIMGNVVTLEAEVTDDDVSRYLAELADEESNTELNIEVEEVSDVFWIGNRGWISVLYKDNDPDAGGEFEISVTRQGTHIYAISFHYSGAEGSDALVESVLTSFVTSGG